MKSPRPEPSLLLDSKKPEGSRASFPALALEQNGQKFYLATIPKEDIFPFCTVSDRFDDPKEGFQRSLDIARAKSIARYLDGSEGSIPTNLVLSARSETELRYDNKKKTIQFLRVSKGFLVLDGQHRLYGYGLTQKPHRVPVAIYEGLERKAEVRLFIDINTTQRGVPAALLLDIKHLAEREDDLEKSLRELFDYLGSQPDSPFFGLTSPSEAAKGKISRPGFNRAVGPVLLLPLMDQLPRNKRYELFKNYTRALDRTLMDPRVLRTNVYLEAFSAIFEEVLRVSREMRGNLKFPSLCDAVAPFAQLNFANVSAKGKARLTKNTLLEVLKQQLRGSVAIDADMV
jgi:DNA sulfur modification protein DndB